MTDLAQRLPFQKLLARIEPQDGSRHLANGRHRLYHHLMEHEMVRPAINAGVEKAAKLARLREDGANVAAFVAVAEHAGIGQVFRLGRPAVFLADDVIHFAAKEGVILVDEAVFAEMVGSCGDQAPEFSTDVAQGLTFARDGVAP